MAKNSSGKSGASFQLMLAAVLVLMALGVIVILFLRFDYAAVRNILTKLGFVGLFLISFVTSLIFFTFPSEPIIILSVKFFHDPLLIIAIATFGSTLAAVVNYHIGAQGIRSTFHWLKRNRNEELKAEKWFNKWGSIIVFFAPSIPFFGDAITVIAGALKMDLKKFLLYTVAGRAVKTVLLIYFGELLFGLPIFGG